MAAAVLAGCGDDAAVTAPAGSTAVNGGRWVFPAEEARHEATWMAFPSSRDIWGGDLGGVQQAIADLALVIARFEPVRMLVRSDAHAAAADLVGHDVELIHAPVDDLWARDTLPLFLVAEDPADEQPMVAGRVRFNGWGGKQRHAGDRRLAAFVAEIVGVPLLDPGITGEGGGLEADGRGTVLAARSSWVNPNRNPGRSEAEVAAVLTDLLGAERVLWVDGLAGADITDGHIDALARFADPTTIIHELPSYVEPGEIWYDLAVETGGELGSMVDRDGEPYDLVPLTQPAHPRSRGSEFLASYLNFYVANGAVIVASFGDPDADGLAQDALAVLYPGRAVTAVDIDPVAAGGGGIHCATRQQPAMPA